MGLVAERYGLVYQESTTGWVDCFRDVDGYFAVDRKAADADAIHFDGNASHFVTILTFRICSCRCCSIVVRNNRRGRPDSPQGCQKVPNRLRSPVDADLHRREDSNADMGANFGVESMGLG